jgi:peptide/nickel transport system substrate-binding protein
MTTTALGRRSLAQILGCSAAAIPAGARAQARGGVLVIGIDISDTVTLDPVRQAQYTPPMTLAAVYDSLLTLEPGDYVNVRPSLATAWAAPLMGAAGASPCARG